MKYAPPGPVALAAGRGYQVPGGVPVHTAVYTVVTGGMPGWQITLIAATAALLAALAVIAYRMRAARRRVTASA